MIASSLFHFTKKLSGLKAILNSGLRPSYNFEEIVDVDMDNKFIGVPSVCFCDIPLKFTRIHTKNYGRYGIAFKKEWAICNGIQPIMYRTDNSRYGRISRELFSYENKIGYIFEYDQNSGNDLLLRFFEDNIELLGFGKSIMAQIANTKIYSIAETNFYLEREWRYIPDGLDIILGNADPEDLKKRTNDEYLSQRNEACVKFTLDEISHIVLPNQRIAAKFVIGLSKLRINGKMLSHQECLILAQKVVDLETINEDM